MDQNGLYFRQNVVLEPLFGQWYAWWYLVSPVTAPLYVAHQHLKIMRSFVANPALHAAAAKSPELLGGSYVSLPPERASDVAALLERTVKERARLLEFAEAVKALDALLANHPAGMALADLYPKVPAPLRGYVELIYDLNNRPSFRFLEPLLYRSPYYDEGAQSFLLWRIDSDERDFIFSTPRLPGPLHLALERPFRDPAVDELLALRHRKAPFARFEELCGTRPEQADLLRSLLTEEPPRPLAPRYDGGGVRIRYFGHATVLLETREVSVLTDPVVSYWYPAELGRYTLEDLPEKIDYVIITHTHADHLMFETLIQLRGRIGTVIVPRGNGSPQDPSLRLGLMQTGFKRVVEIGELDEIEVPGGAITGLPFFGEHGDLDIRSKLAYLVRLAGKTAVIAADSDALEPAIYARLRDLFGPVDALFLGMECEGAPFSWSYGPLLRAQLSRRMDQSRRLSGSNHRRAAEIVDLLGPKRVYVYAMGQEPWLNHVMALKYTPESPQMIESDKLLEHCRKAGIAAERPYGRLETLLD
jgi:L-ascorbate metabolism protein UlaG (beta-lactamase superfamily)